MKTVGKVESLWRYPVKSLRRQQLPQGFIGYAGVYGDRLYRFPDRTVPPPNLAAAEALGQAVYAAVSVKGNILPGDTINLLD